MRRRCTYGSSPSPRESRVAEAAQPSEDYDDSQRQDVARLRKHAVGLGGVLFLTVTGSAPIWAMLFNAVVVIVGVGTAFYFKRYKPAKYEQAGRLINEGL